LQSQRPKLFIYAHQSVCNYLASQTRRAIFRGLRLERKCQNTSALSVIATESPSSIAGGALRPSKLSEVSLRLFSLNHNDPCDPTSAIKTQTHASTRSDQMRVNGPAVFVAIANLFSEHVRYWLGVGRRLHNDRRGGLHGSWSGVQRGHRADDHR